MQSAASRAANLLTGGRKLSESLATRRLDRDRKYGARRAAGERPLAALDCPPRLGAFGALFALGAPQAQCAALIGAESRGSSGQSAPRDDRANEAARRPKVDQPPRCGRRSTSRGFNGRANFLRRSLRAALCASTWAHVAPPGDPRTSEPAVSQRLWPLRPQESSGRQDAPSEHRPSIRALSAPSNPH